VNESISLDLSPSELSFACLAATERRLRSVSASGGAATQQIARRRAPRPAASPPTRAIVGARARAVTMATVRPP
jgi:hypothetical protein